MKKAALFLAAAMLTCSVSCSSKNVKTSYDATSQSPAANTDNTTSGEKSHITIAIAESPNTWRGWQHIGDRIEKLNKSDSPYTVEIKHYEFDEDDYNGDTSISRLSMDILAGKAPDVVSAAPFQLDKFSRHGYLTDLSPLMDSGSGIVKSDLLDNVMESVNEDGKTNVIYPAFDVYTAAAKPEFVGDKENWTVDEAIAAYNSFSGDFLADMFTKYDIRHYFFNGVMLDSIDCKSHTCDLDSSLVPVLDFLTQLPPMEKRLGDGTAIIGQIHDNSALVKEQQISGINQFYASEILRTFGNEPMTFVGYPTNNGKGSYAEISCGFGIMENSKHKEEAWQAISELFFSDDFQREISDYSYGVPVRKNTLESLLHPETTSDITSAEDASAGAKPPFDTSITASVEVPNGELMRLNSEQIRQLGDFLENLEIDPFVDPAMEQIIKEESDYVFEGERTIDQCVNILQNRIELYLSESQ
ncbi:ABC-type glycerol-3-phosphate transport system, substrate-binding protein [Ruminococcus sp. YRD2003]|uniref:extracellular solute-binding protein n=1 Tax=Ruminococcus sp. YRD2003 TaxID=1452313 RepID=UPI0008D10282|nr:ABC-type glycerol-3-phosphate transport system, substrate-binding protein [Ruminococcus flavefaciens]